MSEERITPPYTTHNSFNQDIMFNFGYSGVKFKGIGLKPESVSPIHGNEVNLWIRYKVKIFSHRFYIRELLI